MDLRRALAVAPVASAGGAERALIQLATCLPQHGWQLDLVCLADGPLVRWAARAGLPCEVLAAGRSRQLHRTAFTVGRLAHRVATGGYEVVVSNMNKGHLYGGGAAVLTRRPAIWWQHGIPAGGRMELLAARVPHDAVVAGSVAAVRAQRALTPRADVRRIAPGTPVEMWAARRGSGAEVRADLHWEDAVIVGVPGRLHDEKGQEVFLRAAGRVVAACPRTRFLLIGGPVLGWEGDIEARLRAQADRLGLSGVVHFAGQQDDPVPWVDAMDVVVVPSRTESFGLVVIEALALGKPVVATATPGPAEILSGELAGLLVPVDDDVQLAERVLRVLGDPALRERLRRAGSTRALDFTSQGSAAHWARLLDHVSR